MPSGSSGDLSEYHLASVRLSSSAWPSGTGGFLAGQFLADVLADRAATSAAVPGVPGEEMISLANSAAFIQSRIEIVASGTEG